MVGFERRPAHIFKSKMSSDVHLISQITESCLAQAGDIISRNHIQSISLSVGHYQQHFWKYFSLILCYPPDSLQTNPARFSNAISLSSRLNFSQKGLTEKMIASNPQKKCKEIKGIISARVGGFWA